MNVYVPKLHLKDVECILSHLMTRRCSITILAISNFARVATTAPDPLSSRNIQNVQMTPV